MRSLTSGIIAFVIAAILVLVYYNWLR